MLRLCGDLDELPDRRPGAAFCHNLRRIEALRLAEIDADDIRADHRRSCEIGAINLDAGQFRELQIRAREIGTSEVGPSEISLFEIGAGKVDVRTVALEKPQRSRFL